MAKLDYEGDKTHGGGHKSYYETNNSDPIWHN
jgi:hypothetical protein